MRSLRYFFPQWSQWMSWANRSHTLAHAELTPCPEWRALYIAALFEKDPGRMTERIHQAKRALVVRARELFVTRENHLQEQSAIDETLVALQALERCTGHACMPRE